ncbi:MAG: hypothetical protein IPJ65_39330 [Archangiaceae bacterium]|nr:hypothetical protein [Archangiaceae bacterium]
MICLSCAELKRARRGADCPTCGHALLDETSETLEQLVAARLRAKLRAWENQGELDAPTRARLEGSLPTVAAPQGKKKRSLAQRADALSARLPGADALRPSWLDSLEHAFRERDDWQRPKEPHPDATADAASGASAAMFSGRSTGALTQGLHGLADLDEGSASLGSVIGEYVWWFIGTLLVLAGSVMGVREAWLALGGVPRLLVVAGALLAYHGGFVALSSVVAKKSGVAGRVLGGIALALLPVVFAALSALVALSLPAGLVASAVATAGCALTLRVLGRRFEGDAFALGVAFLPSLLAELPLSLSTLTQEVRALLPLVGVVACGLAVRTRAAGGRLSPSAALLSLYGLLALGVFTVVGAPGQPALALDFGSFGFVALTAWAAALTIAVVPALAEEKTRAAYPHAAPVAEVIALALAASAGVSAFAGALAVTLGADRRADTFAAVVPLLAAASFAVVRSQRRHAVHPAIVLAVLSSMLVARLEWQGNAAGWMLGPAAVAALLFLAARFAAVRADGVLLAAWGALVGVASVVAARSLDVAPLRATVMAAVLVAVSAHATAAWKNFGLHYVGGIAVLLGLEAFSALPGTLPLLLIAAAAAYLLAGRLWRLHPAADATTWPLDDLSLAAGLLSAALLLPGVLTASGPTLLLYETAAGAALVLFARAWLDKSRAVAFVAASLLGAAVYVATASQLLVGGAALALAALAVVRGRGHPNGERGRRLLGALPLPFGARGRLLWGDGFASAALLFTVLAALRTAAFLTVLSEADRPAAVLCGACVIAVLLLAFFTRAFASFEARGHFATWCLAGGAVVLVALANRLGRPLPPQVVGLRFTFIVPALWGFSLLVRRFGPALGRWLEREAHGPLYHWVPHAGVGALGALCVVEGVLVGGPDPTRFLVTAPPLLFVAGALACLLLGRSFRLAPLVAAALAILIIAAACVGAQHALVGPELVQATRGGPWARVLAALPATLVWEHAALGVAVLAFAYAALAALAAFPTPRALLARAVFGAEALLEQPVPGQLLAAWAERVAFGGFAAALLQPRLPAAVLLAGTAALLWLAAERQAASRLALFAFAAVHAALAVAPGVVPQWAGPLAGAAGLGFLAARVRRQVDEAKLWRAQVGATLLSGSGLLWALAAGGQVDRDFAAPTVLGSAAWGAWAAWPQCVAVPVAVACLAATCWLAASKWSGALRRWNLTAATLAAGVTAAAAVAVALEPGLGAAVPGDFVWGRLVVREGGPLALALVAVAVGAHVRGRGLDLGRDLLGPGVGLTLALFVGFGDVSELGFATAGAALLGVFAVGVHAALRDRTGRHAWAAQVAVVAGYALVQAQWENLAPALDAVFGLGFAFALVGVTVLARRAGVAPVARATRAFAALLPVVVAIAFPSGPSGDTAVLAAASSLLYAVLATVEHNRFFGALAAVSANLALLVLALSQGLSGIEVFLAPLGLLLLVLAQLFKKSLLHPARTALRLTGGLLLYAPAALKLSLQLGNAADATYAVVFGCVCLLGVGAGMVLQIRAYLAMGTLFLTLDVVANLVNAGLRDYRIGFVVLSAAGLSVLAAMVFATLKRELVQAWVSQVRLRLRGWD